jgi:hypothetical protein
MANVINVPTHNPTNLMLDASVSLNAAAFAASDAGVHSADQSTANRGLHNYTT